MAEDDAEFGPSGKPHGIDIITVAHDERFRPRQPRIGRPGGERDRERRIDDAGAERGDEGERQQ
ncbi:hypothetical protein D3C87_2132740 [compost metagenome]